MPQAIPMRLYGLDDQIGVIDPYQIALEQLGKIANELPPEKWGEAAKKLPENFVRSLCKEGAKEDIMQMLPDIGMALAAGVGVGVATNSTMWGAGAAVAAYFVVRAVKGA